MLDEELFRSNDFFVLEVLEGANRAPSLASVGASTGSQPKASMTITPSRSWTHDRIPEFARFLLDGNEASRPATPPSPTSRKPNAGMVFPDNESVHSAVFVPDVLPDTMVTFAPKMMSEPVGL